MYGLLAVAGCVDFASTGGATIDPLDPLIGQWQPIDSDERPTGDATISFDADGHYATGLCTGNWWRVDATTIHLVGDSCDVERDSLVRVEANHMLLDGQSGNHMWSWGGSGSCTQHGGNVPTSWSVSFHQNGSISGFIGMCNGNPGGAGQYPCTGTWNLKPFGLEVTTMCPRWDDYFRLHDAIAPVGYARVP
jgi:hypothetical protein